MTEAEWLVCTDPEHMLELVRRRANDRKLRLFACACCRRLWDQVNTALHRTVELAERYADGGASLSDLQAAEQAARRLATDRSASLHGQAFAGAASLYAAGQGFWAALSAAQCAADAVAGCSEGMIDEAGDELLVLGERIAQCQILRDLFGNPFHPLHSDSAWRTGDVLTLAQGVYDDRAFDRLLILADALEEAGCTEPAILDHLRGPGPHVRGCFALDLCLGKS